MVHVEGCVGYGANVGRVRGARAGVWATGGIGTGVMEVMGMSLVLTVEGVMMAVRLGMGGEGGLLLALPGQHKQCGEPEHPRNAGAVGAAKASAAVEATLSLCSRSVFSWTA